MNNLFFLKLGGSAITDKTREQTPREDVIRRVAREINRALNSNFKLKLLIGHGSGSFGHFAAKKSGFGQRGNWRAYAETGAAASRLTRIVADIFLEEGVPVVAMQPSASALCRDGQLVQFATTPIQTALAHNLIPLVHGDVAFDETRDMTIASTEMIFAYLAPILKPTRVILAGIVDGVFTADPLRDSSAKLIREITPANFSEIESRLRGSHGVDVTGGMVDKVRKMVALVQQLEMASLERGEKNDRDEKTRGAAAQYRVDARPVEGHPSVRVQIISATREGWVTRALVEENFSEGTTIHI